MNKNNIHTFGSFIKLHVILMLLLIGCHSVSAADCIDHTFQQDVATLQRLPALHKAIIARNNAEVFRCLKSTKDIDQLDEFGNTPLHLIMLMGRWDIMDPFLLRKPNFDAKNNYDLTPEDMKNVRILISKGMLFFVRLVFYSNLQKISS